MRIGLHDFSNETSCVDAFVKKLLRVRLSRMLQLENRLDPTSVPYNIRSCIGLRCGTLDG